jgi:hypothetical protein
MRQFFGVGVGVGENFLQGQVLSHLRRLEAKTSGVPHDVATERGLADHGPAIQQL